MRPLEHKIDLREISGRCRQIMKRKNEARSKWLQQKTRASYETYNTKRKKANNLINQKKKMA
jgi:hypothetical protein